MVTNNHPEEEKEKKNKRRGLVIAFFLHVVLLIIALIPFMNPEVEDKADIIIELANYTPPPPPPPPLPEEIPFDESGSSDPDNAKGEVEEPMEQEAAPDTPEPPAEPTPAEPTPPTPVETTPKPSPVEAPEAPKPPKPTPPKPPKPTKPSPPKDVPSKPTKPTKPTKPSNGSSSDTSNGSGTKPGKPGRPDGTDNSGNAGNNGNGGTDDGGGIGDGSGYGFARKVITRPSLSQIKAMAMGKKGIIVLDICISRFGKVTKAKAIKSASTIKDDQVLARAEKLMLQYKYEKDMKAPASHCNKFAFNIKDDKGGAKPRLMPSEYGMEMFFID